MRKKLFNEAIALSTQMVKVMLAAELDSSAFKVLASVTVIQLAQGDAVKVPYLTNSCDSQNELCLETSCDMTGTANIPTGAHECARLSSV